MQGHANITIGYFTQVWYTQLKVWETLEDILHDANIANFASVSLVRRTVGLLASVDEAWLVETNTSLVDFIHTGMVGRNGLDM